MGKRKCRAALLLAGLAWSGACLDSEAGPQTGGHTNWLACEVVADCAAVTGAADCVDGLCVDDDEQPIPEPRLDSVPDGWVEVLTRCGYRYMAPPEARMDAVIGIDSCVDQYVTDNCYYEDGYGAFDTEFGDKLLGTTTQSIEVDGLEGTLLSAVRPHEDTSASDPPYVLFVRLPPDEANLYGTFFARCRTPEGRAEARLTITTLQRPISMR